MTNSRLLMFIAIVLSILTIAVIWVGVSFSKSQNVITTNEKAIVAPVIDEDIVLEKSAKDKAIKPDPVNKLISGVDHEHIEVESSSDNNDEHQRSGTDVYYDESYDYHPITGEPIYWVDGVEVTSKQWYEATGGADEERYSLEAIEEIRRNNAPF